MNQPDLGKKIVELRKAKGLTQEELVEKCNLNVRTLQRIESGEVTPRNYTIKTIFTALDYVHDSSESTNNRFNERISIVSNWLEQFYKQFLNLFNLKTNTMKKISILSLVLLVIISLAFNLRVHSQSTKSNPLLGNWKLIGITKDVLNLKDSASHSTILKINNYTTRFLEFKSDLSFETRTIQNDVYNGGAYSILNDTSFITVHFELNGKLADISHIYRFKINKDTLHFQGYYLDRAQGLGENFYEKKIVDEWWIKLKDKK